MDIYRNQFLYLILSLGFIRLKQISNITYDGQEIQGYYISHDDLIKGKELVITTK